MPQAMPLFIPANVVQCGGVERLVIFILVDEKPQEATRD